MPSNLAAETLTVHGRVVAYSSIPTCLNEYLSVIIRLERPADSASKYLRVFFSAPCGSPQGWVRSGAIHQFRLVRDEPSDQVLSEFLECQENSEKGTVSTCPASPAWIRVHGTEREPLPYGKTIPSYLAADLPVAPVL